MKIPTKYDKYEYISWHEKKYPKDKELISKIENLRRELKDNSEQELSFASNIIQTVISMASNEYRIQKGVGFDAEFPLLKILIDHKKKSTEYDFLFKSTDSIINKLWRRNKQGDEIQLSNIKENITDLVRTEITTPTLESCKFLAERLEKENIFFPDKKQEQEFKEKIKKISFEPEMKMASGYFAYHGLIEFKTGLIIEVQIYSSLMKSWRKLSHKLYENVRVRTSNKILDYGTAETRLISLGHLLHLAECEMTRLENEI